MEGIKIAGKKGSGNPLREKGSEVVTEVLQPSRIWYTTS